MLGLPEHVDVEAVARHELRWWVVRREIGLAAGTAAGDAITDLYAALYDVPRERVAEAGRLRGIAAEIRDRGASGDPDGPRGAGTTYWPEVARLLRQSYRSLSRAINEKTRRRRSKKRRRGSPSAPDGGPKTYRSSGRRPMSHHATGKMPAATAAWPRPRAMNGLSPLVIVSATVRWRLYASQGSPIA